ncbi:hypothetical protein BC828DRAFT_394627 [Blastocladiella britannica]|nr:hypothetical protein BC828DRAFT_394627 [Blastocladiella britannica]
MSPFSLLPAEIARRVLAHLPCISDRLDLAATASHWNSLILGSPSTQDGDDDNDPPALFAEGTIHLAEQHLFNLASLQVAHRARIAFAQVISLHVLPDTQDHFHAQDSATDLHTPLCSESAIASLFTTAKRLGSLHIAGTSPRLSESHLISILAACGRISWLNARNCSQLGATLAEILAFRRWDVLDVGFTRLHAAGIDALLKRNPGALARASHIGVAGLALPPATVSALLASLADSSVCKLDLSHVPGVIGHIHLPVLAPRMQVDVSYAGGISTESVLAARARGVAVQWHREPVLVHVDTAKAAGRREITSSKGPSWDAAVRMGARLESARRGRGVMAL